MNIYYIRTDIWKLNRSFVHIKDAQLYMRKLLVKYPKIKTLLLHNGNLIPLGNGVRV